MSSAPFPPARVKPGVIRGARRPTGWAPGGPVPPGDQGKAHLQPAPGEDLCFLTGEFRIFQRQDGHRWSLDDLMTAWVASQRVASQPRSYLDMGCGIGSVLIMLAWKFGEAAGTGIEAQDLSAGLARRSLEYNGLIGRVQVVQGDLREVILPHKFSLVTGTPPYFLPEAGVQSEKPQCAPCRFEHRGGVEAYCEAAARHLDQDGLFVMVTAAFQAPRVGGAARALGLAQTYQLDVVPRGDKDPLISVFALQKTKRPVQQTRELLVVRDRAGQWTQDFQSVRRQMGLPWQPPTSRSEPIA